MERFTRISDIQDRRNPGRENKMWLCNDTIAKTGQVENLKMLAC